MLLTKPDCGLAKRHLHCLPADACIAALSDALKVNGMLTTLHLRGNQINAAGAQSLLEALRVNAALTTLLIVGPALNAQLRATIDAKLHLNQQRKSTT